MLCSRIKNADTTPRPGLIGPLRLRVQLACALLVLLVPFVRPGGTGLLRIDLPHGRLELFGRLLFPDEFYLLLLAALCLTALFLAATLVLGRLWCGWACPQTVLSDLVEGAARRLGLQNGGGRMDGSPLSRLLFHGFCLGVSLMVASNLVWYFLPPAEFFPRLAEGEFGAAPALSLVILTSVVYFDLAFVRRLLCREFCPYGRFQTALVDSGTLTLRFEPAAKESCLNCAACLRACPTGIDVRRGFQVECIACGRCLDACRRVMAVRNRPGLIRYSFGNAGEGPAVLLNARTLLLATVFAGLAAAFLAGALDRPSASFVLSRSPAEPRLLPEGSTAIFYTARVGNRSEHPATFRLHAATAAGIPIELWGQVGRILLKGHERRRLDFALIAPWSASVQSSSVVFSLKAADGRLMSEVRTDLSFPPNPKNGNPADSGARNKP